MFWFGRPYDGLLTARSIRRLSQDAAASLGRLAHTELRAVLDACESVGVLWRVDSPFSSRARTILALEHRWPAALVESALRTIPTLLSRDRLAQRVRADFFEPSLLDDFLDVSYQKGRGRVLPLGVLLHDLSGACCIHAVEAIVAGLVTKNVSVLQASARDQRFIELFLQSLQEADETDMLARSVALVDRTGDLEKLGSILESCIDGIVTWGARSPSESQEWKVPSGIKHIHVESRVPMHVISRRFWEDCNRAGLAEKLIPDSCLWEADGADGIQYFCFVEHGIDIRSVKRALARRHHDVMDKATGTHPSGHGQSDQANASETKELSRQHSHETRSFVITSFRSLDELKQLVRSLIGCPHLCGYGVEARERDHYLHILGMIGIRNFVPLDRNQSSANGAFDIRPCPLRELVHFVKDEREFTIGDLLAEAGSRVPFYLQRKPEGAVTDLQRWPLTSGADLASEPLHRSRSCLGSSVQCGLIFSSGGTSSAPKYALYAPEEFACTAEMLARSFMASGLRRGQTAVNLFVAGNLWSSFLIVDEALRKCGVYVLPMGGRSPLDEIVACLASFRPDVAFGLPSLLVDCARYAEEHHQELSIETIFYAGERLSPSASRYLQDVWKTKSFRSAGYATVDAGPIGWQCAHCGEGEHHLFSSEVHMEIVEGEAVVTSLLRRAMPVIRYRTGDAVQWLNGPCPCGSMEPRFTLLGRLDGLMNVWGCRVAFSDVERSLIEAGVTASIMQIRLRSEIGISGCQDELVACIEQPNVPPAFFEQFTEKLLHYCSDVALMLDLVTLRQRVRVECVKPNSIPRISRTGKVRLIVDERI